MVNQEAALDRVFHALADPTRRAMVARLGRGSTGLGELAAPLPISLPAALKHLRVLEDAGLVRTEKRGRVRRCAAAPAALSLAERWIGERRSEWEARLDRLGAYLKTLENGHDDDRTDG